MTIGNRIAKTIGYKEVEKNIRPIAWLLILIGLIVALATGCQGVQYESGLIKKNKAEGVRYNKSATGNRMLKKAQNQSEQLIDHAFIRGIQLLAASLVCGVILAVVFIGLKRKKVADAD